MGHEDHCFSWVLFDLGKKGVAFSLKSLIANSQDLIEHKDVTTSLDSNGEGQADLHARRVVLQLLIHEVLELGELDNVVVHLVDFRTREAEKRAVEVDIFASRELRVKTNAKFDKGNELAINRN